MSRRGSASPIRSGGHLEAILSSGAGNVTTTSRIVAGGPITGDVFKCALQPIHEALAEGVYGDVELTAGDLASLAAIFPDGVCDYDQGDIRRPPLQ